MLRLALTMLALTMAAAAAAQARGARVVAGCRVSAVEPLDDGVRVTAEVVPALRAHRVTDTELTRRASDHLPVTVEYDPPAITAP